MPKQSAGILLYRQAESGLQVLLAHPGGPYWAKRDLGAWSIPKGEFDPRMEDALTAACREFHEETGSHATGRFVDLGSIRQAGGKLVHAFAVSGDFDPASLRTQAVTIEWPPQSGQIKQFPEIDRAAWFDLAQARRYILPSQCEFLHRLEQRIS
jgi:predicted NUDIX family NTP pyrophosphohydrolase